MAQLQFCGKVVVVTGAGGGIGRHYALQFAKRGANVVVNDIDCSRSGEGKESKAADVVVSDIVSSGGKAVADYNSVEDGDKIIQTALQKYGKVDVIVNNAGVVRDKSFVKMTEDEWDRVQNVHLKGSFLVTKAAWPYLRQQNYGKVIFTSSAVALLGNFGQANYSAAKMGLVGLCKTLAIEGMKYNISCNTIIPTAITRMTENLLPGEIHEALNPEHVAPLVLWLSHDTCTENGGLFEAGAGWVGKHEFRRSQGVNCMDEGKITPENISKHWEKITDMSSGIVLDSIHSQISSIISSKPLQPGVMIKNFEYAPKDLILYALSIGCSKSALKYTYENHDDFTPFPTFAVIPSVNMIINDLSDLEELISAKTPNLKVELMHTLHGEHFMELHKPLPANGGRLTSQLELVDIIDKKSGIILVLNINSYDENDELVCFNQFNAFVTNGGNFGGKRTSEKVHRLVQKPNRPPDSERKYKTSENQSALYRLNGDENPMHIDPEFSEAGGFSEPILHGLCTLGISTNHVLQEYGNDDPKKFKSIKVRFSGPVIPGETLCTKMWKVGSRIHFETETMESSKVVISGAYIDLKDVTDDSTLKSTVIFEQLNERIGKNPDISRNISAIFIWNIIQNNEKVKSWTINLQENPGVRENEETAPDCTLSCSDETVISMMSGNLDPTKAVMKGELKIEGDIMLSRKLGDLLKNASKL